MRVVLLGTGGSTGVPAIGGADGRGDWGECDPAEPRNRRRRAAVALEDGAGVLLVDTPPEIRESLVACGIGRIEAVLYTHAHADHITGMDDLRQLNRIADRPLDAFATQATLDELTRRFDYAFRPWQPPGFYRPVLMPRAIAPGEAIETAGLCVRIFDQDHGFGRSLGLRVKDFVYSTDVVAFPPESFAMLAGLDTWVVDCFQRRSHQSHAWLGQVLKWVETLRPRRTVLTHMGLDMDWSWLLANLPPGVEPGYDGMVLEVG